MLEEPARRPSAWTILRDAGLILVGAMAIGLSALAVVVTVVLRPF